MDCDCGHNAEEHDFGQGDCDACSCTRFFPPEPKTMAHAQGFVEALFPKHRYNVWIEGGKRFISLKASLCWIDESGDTWTEAAETLAAKMSRRLQR